MDGRLQQFVSDPEMNLANANADRRFTNEYSGDYNELLYLRARFYAPGMGRFLTRDIWGGDYNRPLSLNRWNYGYGNPVKYTDPTGHRPCVLDLSGYSGWTGKGWNAADIKKRVDLAEKYVSQTSDYMDTYVAAGIAIQCAGFDEKNDYSGRGIAQITKKQVETPWGEIIEDKDGFRGYGLQLCTDTRLGLLNPDNPNDSVILMKREIQIVMYECHKDCTNTDKYIVAALSQNGPGFSYMELRKLATMDKAERERHFYEPDIKMNWFLRWRDDNDGDMRNTITQLNRFILVVNELQKRGWTVPSIDLNTINDLKNPANAANW